MEHDHFKLLYHRHPEDAKVNPEAATAIFEAAKTKFGEENVRHDKYTQKGGAKVFPVLMRDGRIASSVELSETLQHLPGVAVDFVFVHPDILDPSLAWLSKELTTLIQPKKETP